MTLISGIGIEDNKLKKEFRTVLIYTSSLINEETKHVENISEALVLNLVNNKRDLIENYMLKTNYSPEAIAAFFTDKETYVTLTRTAIINKSNKMTLYKS